MIFCCVIYFIAHVTSAYKCKEFLKKSNAVQNAECYWLLYLQLKSFYENAMNTIKLRCILWFFLLGWLNIPVVGGNVREKVNFDFDWKFLLNKDDTSNSSLNVSTEGWQDVQLPHDWSISQSFDSKLSGSNGHLPGGIGWYRKSFCIDKDDMGKRVSVLFDGIYSRSDVYFNGKHLGFRPYGFCYQEYDLTPYIKYGEENVLAVRVNNPLEHDSVARWYTGAGIYRHAWLVKTSETHVALYGTYVTTPRICEESAAVNVRTTIENEAMVNKKISVRQCILGADNEVIAKSKSKVMEVASGQTVEVVHDLEILNPQLWDTETPYLYTLQTLLYEGRKLVDSYETVFGVRTCEFTPDRGFLLNGKRVKLKGFCLHQDDASLGTALPLRSMERKLQIIKEYGVNAIRCSHNQPAPEFLDLCDKMGFLVIDEAFDKWKSGYYAAYFDEWWREDLRNMLLRDRNHPCIILWSIGNELQEAWDSSNEGCRRAVMLQDYVHVFEPTRQVCLAAQNRHNEMFAGVTDVVGYNYLEARMMSDHKKFPERCFLVTEELPYYRGAEGNIRSYDTDNPWNIIAENDFIAGGFIWAGTDYIGEAGWPSHGWPTGLFDICMIEKPRAAFHRAVWNDEPMVRIAVRDNALDIDHGRDLWQWPKMASVWNFPRSYEGLVIELNTITNCEKVALFKDGVEMGVRKTADYPNNTIVWCLPYHPGKLQAKGINGVDTVAVYEIKTAGEPVYVRLSPDRKELWADGQDLSYIQLELLDKDGVLVQHRDRMVDVSIEGEGKLIGFINSDLRRDTPFTSDCDETYFGRAMAIVQTTRKAGKIRLRFDVEGMEEPYFMELSTVELPKNYKSDIPSFR